MYRKTYYATHPGSIHGATNEDLLERYLMRELFAADEIRLNYTHFLFHLVHGRGEPRLYRHERARHLPVEVAAIGQVGSDPPMASLTDLKNSA